MNCPYNVGGTRSSGPPFDVRSSLAFPRGLKSRAECGAKAPHSMECGDLSPLFREGFSLHHLAVDLGGTGPSNPCDGRRRCTARSSDVGSTMPPPRGTTSVPLRV